VAPHPSSLSWRDVCAALGEDSLGLTLKSVAPLALPHVPPKRPAQRLGDDASMLAGISRTFCDHFGPWGTGWSWGVGEGGGGGPVRGWCCPPHSAWLASDTGPEQTALRAAAGLLSWRDWIRELSVLFASPGLDPDPVRAFDQLAHRAAHARRVGQTRHGALRARP
jgi:hypothetical protein